MHGSVGSGRVVCCRENSGEAFLSLWVSLAEHLLHLCWRKLPPGTPNQQTAIPHQDDIDIELNSAYTLFAFLSLRAGPSPTPSSPSLPTHTYPRNTSRDDHPAQRREKRGPSRHQNSFSFTSQRHQLLLPTNPHIRHRPRGTTPTAPIWRPQRPRQNIHEPLRPSWRGHQVGNEIWRLAQDEGDYTQRPRLADQRDQSLRSPRKRRRWLPVWTQICMSCTHPVFLFLRILTCVR